MSLDKVKPSALGTAILPPLPGDAVAAFALPKPSISSLVDGRDRYFFASVGSNLLDSI